MTFWLDFAEVQEGMYVGKKEEINTILSEFLMELSL